MTADSVRRMIAMVLSVVGLIAFAIIYIVVACKGNGVVSKYPNLEYVGTALAGLVGGFVAAAFGQKLQNPPAHPAAAGAPVAASTPPSRLRAAAQRLGAYIPHAAAPETPPAGSPISITEWIGFAYIVVYFVVAIVAVIVWIASSTPPEMIKNLALIALGLFVAIVGSTLRS